MADNVEITAGTGTSVATDDVGGVHYQRIKLDLGGDGAASPLVRGQQAKANSIPVTLASDEDLLALIDGLEGYVDGLETLATALNGYVDGLEGFVDGLETLIGTTNTNTGNAATSLAVIEDWDESDRAKVNIIVGQAGVTAGAGSVAANTPRVTMASDSPDVTALQIMGDWDNGASDGASVSGDVAHDSADAGEPVKIGGKALDLGATPTAVSANDRVNGAFLRNGVQLQLGGEPNIISKNLNITDADGAQTDAAIITVSAGTAIVVTKASVMADGANSGDVAVRIGFGTANVPAADSAGIILAHPGIKSGSGVVEGNGSGIIGIGASNEDLRLTCEDPAGGAIDVVITYFTIAIG